MSYDARSNANPFLPGAVQGAASNPGLDDVLAYVSHRTALGLRVCMPARVVNVRSPQYVDLQPTIKQRVFTELKDYPVVAGALVSMAVGGDYAVTLPLAVGDTGLLICADRSLDAYVAGDGYKPSDPASERCHNLTDAIFVPGLVPLAKQTPPTTDLVVRNGQAQVALQKTGTVSISNAQNELVDLLCQVVQKLVTAQVLTAFGPSPLLASDQIAFGQLLAKLQTFKKVG